MRSSRFVFLLVPCVPFLASCDATTQESGPHFYDGAYAYSQVTLGSAIIRPGMTAKAHVIAYDDAGHPLGELATPWTGDNNAVAVVDSDGTIHAVSAGLVTLGTDILPHPSLTSLYVTPDDSCGDVTNVTDWAVEGGLAWALEADSTNSVGQAHHAMSWSFTAVEPRQVNTGEIVWSPAPPDTSQHFTVQVHDTVQVGDTVVADRVGSVVRLLGGYGSTSSPANSPRSCIPRFPTRPSSCAPLIPIPSCSGTSTALRSPSALAR